MRYLIIGLGIYGTNLAVDLTAMGHEVIAADVDSSAVDAIKDKVSSVYILDSTEETSLSVLPLNAVDLVIVAIGENFGSSIKTVALLKKMGVKSIYARAVDDIHQTILEGFKVDRILVPEQRAAHELTRELELGAKIDALQIDSDNYILKFAAPAFFVGVEVGRLDLEHRFGIKFISLSRLTERRNVVGLTTGVMTVVKNPDPTLKIQLGDELTVMASQRQFRDLMRHIN
jgi:trk system potassium uptake protein TrkA